MIQKAVSFLHKDVLVWGPLFLLCTLAIGTSAPLDLVLLALVGLYLSARFKVRGCCYAFVLLAISAAIKHTFFTTDHLWQLGLESSLGCAFFITALAFEQGDALLGSLQSQMQLRKDALQNLEEELTKRQEIGQEQQIAFQEKLAGLQKELEDLQADHSSILILNEVLRKTTARASQENEALAAQKIDQERQAHLLKAELEECEKTLKRLSSSDSLVLQNKELMKELNAARYEKEQTHLINEVLARLYFKESLKAKEADQEAGSFAEQLSAARKEVERIEPPLKERIAQQQQEIDALALQLEKATLEAHQGQTALMKLQEMQNERNFLKEQLETALQELEVAQKKAPQQDPRLVEELAFAQERMAHLSQVEPLFKQLKKQFEEKNQVLHQTRSELFKTDTELQRLKMESASLELYSLPREMERELYVLGEQVEVLEVENQELQEVISALLENTSDASKRKKKLKIQTSPEQELLF